MQHALLVQWMGAGRWTWNHGLERRQKAYRRRKASVTGGDVSRSLTALKRTRRYKWLKQVPSSVLTQKLRDQDAAFKAFFEGRARHPRFKRRGHSDSIRLQLDQRLPALRAAWESGEVRVPGLGVVKARGRAPGAFPKMVTIRRDAVGRFFASVMVEEPRPQAVAATGIRRQ